jgi:N-hydroxyarylamine O-acetyltransferase
VIDRQKYLTRIGCAEEKPSLRYLRILVRQHHQEVPFENLDIIYHQQIRLSVDQFYNKIVERNRGGYNFELNALFYELLQQLNFDVSLYQSQCYNKDKQQYSKPFSHMVLIVMLEGKEYLVDVGNTVSLTAPIELAGKTPQLVGNNYFQSEDGEGWSLSRSRDAHTFVPILKIGAEKIRLIEFLAMNDFHQEDIESKLNKDLFVSRTNQMEPVLLKKRTLEITTKGETEKITIYSDSELFSLLQQHFGIKFPLLINQEGA